MPKNTTLNYPQEKSVNPADGEYSSDPRYEQLHTRLLDLLDGSEDYVKSWLELPHPKLGGRTPISYLNEGKFGTVEFLVYSIETGLPD